MGRGATMRLPLALAASVWCHAVLAVWVLDWAPTAAPGGVGARALGVEAAGATPALRLRLQPPPDPASASPAPVEAATPTPPDPRRPSEREPESAATPAAAPGEQAPTEVSARPSEPSELDGFGQVRGRFLDRSELNRFPVLQGTVRFDTSGLGPDDLNWGHADLWLYLSAQGRVVAVRVDASDLSPAALQVAFRGIREARFMPGYLDGRPVASRIRWRVMVTAEGGVQGAAGGS